MKSTWPLTEWKSQKFTHRKNSSWNQLYSNCFSKNVAFTKFLSEMCESKFPSFPQFFKKIRFLEKFREFDFIQIYAHNKFISRKKCLAIRIGAWHISIRGCVIPWTYVNPCTHASQVFAISNFREIDLSNPALNRNLFLYMKYLVHIFIVNSISN